MAQISVERIVQALARVEGGQDFQAGDNGHALGRWQLHVEFFCRWYRPAPGSFVAWPEAEHHAVVNFVSHYLGLGLMPVRIAVAFHLGESAVLVRGEWDEQYAQKFTAAWLALGGAPGDAGAA